MDEWERRKEGREVEEKIYSNNIFFPCHKLILERYATKWCV